MRTTAFIVYYNKKFEIFVEKRKDGFELWAVGPIKGRRTLLDHHLTHDDVEAHLEYAKPGDLVWRDAALSEIPTEKHRSAVEGEQTIQRGAFCDCLSHPEKPFQNVVNHLSALVIIARDRKGAKDAKKALLGQWTDGVATLDIKPNNELELSCTDLGHPLNIGKGVQSEVSERWEFKEWQLSFLNKKKQWISSLRVLHADEQRLHFQSMHPNRLAHIFRKIQEHEEVHVTTKEVVPKVSSDLEGIHTSEALLELLYQAIHRRNPVLADSLQPGLPKDNIREMLQAAEVKGYIEPIVDLFAWKNGPAPDPSEMPEELSLFPGSIYDFEDLKTAIAHFVGCREALEFVGHPKFDEIDGRYFPLFWDMFTGYLAVDLQSAENRVVLFELELPELVMEIYVSFEAFLKDAIRANEEDEHMTFETG
jgi:hypothetical protein